MDKIKVVFDKLKTHAVKIKDVIVKYTDKVVKKAKELDLTTVKKYLKKATDFVILHKRYFCAGLLFVVFCLLMILATGKGNSVFDNSSASGDAGKFEKNKHEDVNQLIENYYAAYADGDCEQLVQYIEPLSHNEAEYIKLFSGFIENITVKNVYTQQGVNEGSYLVSVEMAIKFHGVDTEAPGMEFFYIQTGREDKLYIDNLYSQFNMQVNEYVKDEAVLAAIYAYEDRTELKEVQIRIEEEYSKAMQADAKLVEMVTTTVARAISAWMTSIEIVVNQAPPQGSLSVKDDIVPDIDATDKEQEVPKQEILDVVVVEKVVTVDKANLRETADKEANLITTVEAGVTLEVVSIDAWGGWTCVKVDNYTGYIRNDLIETVETEHSVAGKPAYPKIGQVVLLTENQNAYISMDETVTVIANLKLGTAVTVEMSYANGWSKVSWDDGAMVGYVLTAVLKLD